MVQEIIHPSEELQGSYELECTACKFKRKLDEYASVGWVVGQMVDKDPSNPEFGRCNRCQSYSMRVVKCLKFQLQPTRDCGFTKIPQT